MGRVRFLLGTAGSGKTARCLREIAAEAERQPLGPPLLLLVPEQATFQTERALLGRLGAGATLRAQVAGFSRLALRILEQAGGAAQPRLGERGRAALLEVALTRAQPRFRVLAPMVGSPGLGRPLAATLRELAAWRQSPDSLREAAAGQAGQLGDKLADLAEVWAEYRNLLAGRFTDPDGFGDLAAERLAAAGAFAGARVWVDGFAGFTPQELHLLQELAAVAAETTVALCLSGGTRLDPPNPGELFYPTRATYVDLRRRCALRGLPLAEPVGLDHAPRFARAPALRWIERSLRTRRRMPAGPPAGSALRLWGVADRRAEAEAVAAEIVRLCRREGYRYREIAVLARDLAPYLADLEDTLGAAGIPFFADRRRPIAGHPLPTLLRAALRVAEQGWPSEAVFAYLKTDLAPLSRAQADALEEAARTAGVGGEAWRSRTAWHLPLAAPGAEEPEQAVPLTWQRLTQVRLAAIAPLRRLQRRLGKGRPGAQAIAALRALLREVGAAAKLRAWGQEGIWDAVARLLDELEAALGEAPVSLRELRAAVEAGLSGLTLGLIPPTADQVLLGELERSRQPELRALFLLGAAEDAFPRAAREDAVLPDLEREHLRRAGTELGPGAADRAWHEPYLAYIALTRASERLYVSWPDPRPAAFVKELLAAFPDAALPPAAEAAPGAFAGVLARRLAREGDWPALLPAYHALLQVADLRPQAAAIFAAFGHRGGAGPLAADIVATLFPQPLRVTATRLAAYSACPFQHFATYGLRLRSRAEGRLDAPGLGALLHTALAVAIGGVMASGSDLGALPDAELQELCDAAVDALAIAGADLSPARVRRLREHLLRAVSAAVAAARDEAAAGSFRPVAVEEAFADLDLGGVRLAGKIDRIDTAPLPDGRTVLRVVDYKSRPRPFRPDDVAVGLEWQLPLYLWAAAQLRQAEPAGMLYAPAQDALVGVEGPLPASDAARRARAASRASGMAAADTLGAWGTASGVLPMHLRQDGLPTASSPVVPQDELDRLLEQARAGAVQAAAAIAAGDISPRPWRRGREVACDRCPYPAVCRFDRRLPGHTYRELPDGL